ncbi:hypothetical protein AVEN_158541-1 [Araneus ventricosus]|uniref:Uncharacterized protein n=1 Tax=Araneus ventricosus TaxID=182803 RepID=A0A4Y2IN90_ARAVE|nr:hypothetical protein AVEN_158541-1 [Araneus ventricosus]
MKGYSRGGVNDHPCWESTIHVAFSPNFPVSKVLEEKCRLGIKELKNMPYTSEKDLPCSYMKRISVAESKRQYPQPIILDDQISGACFCELAEEIFRSCLCLIPRKRAQTTALLSRIISILQDSLQKEKEHIEFCCDIDGLLKKLRIAHQPNEWRVFIDALKLSLKAVLLNNGNELPSISVVHAVYMKETYHNLKQLLEMINFSKYGWQICADLKVMSLLMGLQVVYTKYCCFLCLWDSRAIALHYIKRDWPQRASFKPGEMNVKHPLLAEPHKIIIPPLHIKLGLVKDLVQAMDKNGPAFKYLHKKFPLLSVTKIKEGAFVGTQI